MPLTTIVFAAIFFLMAFILFKIVKTAIKFVISLLLLLFIFALFCGIMAYVDFKDVKENIHQNKMYLIEENGALLGGIIKNGNKIMFSQEDFDKYSNNLKRLEYKQMLGDNYRLFIIRTAAIKKINSAIELDGYNLSITSALNILRSNNPAAELPKQAGNSSKYTNNLEIRNQLSEKIVDSLIENEMPLLSEYKAGNIIIYPETAIFKFIKIIPASLIIESLNKFDKEVSK